MTSKTAGRYTPHYPEAATGRRTTATWIRRRVLRLALVAMVLLAAAGEIAYATIPDSNKVFTACMFKATGTIRLIDPSLGSTSLLGHCTSLETPISWNQLGQQGPAGPQGPQGPKGDTGAAGKDGVSVTSASLPAGDSNCPQGGTKLLSANGTSYVCNGKDGAGLVSLTDLNGAPCTTAYGAGSVAVHVGAPSLAGVADVTLTCNGSGPPPATSNPHDDGWGETWSDSIPSLDPTSPPLFDPRIPPPLNGWGYDVVVHYRGQHPDASAPLTGTCGVTGPGTGSGSDYVYVIDDSATDPSPARDDVVWFYSGPDAGKTQRYFDEGLLPGSGDPCIVTSGSAPRSLKNSTWY